MMILKLFHTICVLVGAFTINKKVADAFTPSSTSHRSSGIITQHLFSSSSPNNESPMAESDQRRSFLLTSAAAAAVFTNLLVTSPETANAAGDSTTTMIEDLGISKEKLVTVPDLLKQEKWEEVRTILKTPPVNFLWNMGESRNPLNKIAQSTGEMELIDLKDELSISIQMCDQLTYDNVFVYFQPGNGKVKIKEPVDLAEKAISQLTEAIQLAKAATQ